MNPSCQGEKTVSSQTALEEAPANLGGYKGVNWSEVRSSVSNDAEFLTSEVERLKSELQKSVMQNRDLNARLGGMCRECIEKQKLLEEEWAKRDKEQPAPVDILDEAKKITSGDRRRDYGSALDNFSQIAAFWNAYLGKRLLKPITYRDVALMNILQKVSRDSNAPKRDNLTDTAGYARCAQLATDQEAEG